jgi:hypothetical protein
MRSKLVLPLPCLMGRRARLVSSKSCAQAVKLARESNQRACADSSEEAALAFAMGTHHRLGASSVVNCLRRGMVEFLRSREGRGRRGGTEALRAILSKHVRVPGDFDSIEHAVAAGGSECCLTLYITLGEFGCVFVSCM